MLFNPSLQLAFLVRLAQRGPAFIHHPVRWLQVAIFSSECYWFRGGADERVEIGPGINFPHPSNIIIGAGTKIGSEVTIYNNVTVGTDVSGVPADVWQRAPSIGDEVFLYGYANVQGPHEIGTRAVVGKWVVVTEDLPPGALATAKGVRLEGEWDRSRIWPGESPYRTQQPPK
jgi:serine O-acetyltransferase